MQLKGLLQPTEPLTEEEITEKFRDEYKGLYRNIKLRLCRVCVGFGKKESSISTPTGNSTSLPPGKCPTLRIPARTSNSIRLSLRARCSATTTAANVAMAESHDDAALMYCQVSWSTVGGFKFPSCWSRAVRVPLGLSLAVLDRSSTHLGCP
jgi:hypothetical protein